MVENMQSDKAPNSVLIVEDEPKLAQLLVDYLQVAGYAPRWIANGSEVIDDFKKSPAAIVLLDLMLPGKDGMQVCRELRAFSDVPIVMITARVEEIDRLLGLELGADDYICKPFSPREVVARVKAILRRLQPRSDEMEAIGAGFNIDEQKMKITFNGAALDLTLTEFTLLSTLARRPGRVFSRDALLDQLNAEIRDVSDRAIDSHIKNLRKKLAAINADEAIIHSVYGVGYKLEL